MDVKQAVCVALITSLVCRSVHLRVFCWPNKDTDRTEATRDIAIHVDRIADSE